MNKDEFNLESELTQLEKEIGTKISELIRHPLVRSLRKFT